MEVTLEAVSPHGVKYNGQDWTNIDKKANLGDLKTQFHAGDVVNVTLNSGGYITAMEVAKAAPAKPAWKAKGSFTGGRSFQEDPDRSAKMSRGAAVKAVLESPFVSEKIKSMSDEQALHEIFVFSDKVASYIEKGI